MKYSLIMLTIGLFGFFFKEDESKQKIENRLGHEMIEQQTKPIRLGEGNHFSEPPKE